MGHGRDRVNVGSLIALVTTPTCKVTEGDIRDNKTDIVLKLVQLSGVRGFQAVAIIIHVQVPI